MVLSNQFNLYSAVANTTQLTFITRIQVIYRKNGFISSSRSFSFTNRLPNIEFVVNLKAGNVFNVQFCIYPIPYIR